MSSTYAPSAGSEVNIELQGSIKNNVEVKKSIFRKHIQRIPLALNNFIYNL